MDSKFLPEMDYRSRFIDFLALEYQRNGLVEVWSRANFGFKATHHFMAQETWGGWAL
jgi:hypothetical protein